MKIHPLALSAVLAVFSVSSTDAFVATSPRVKPTASKGSFSDPEKKSRGVLRRLQSAVAEASPTTTRLSVYQDYYEESYYEENEGVNLDAYGQPVYYEEEFMSSSLNIADADATPPQELSSETPVSPPPATAQAAGETALSAFAGSSGLSAGVSAGAVAFGGLAVARTALGQRQKKLDEEKRNLEEQQKRFETESAKLKRDTSQSNLFLSTIGSVAVGTALTSGGLVEEFTESSIRSMEGITEGINLENGIKESVKGGGFKTTAGTVVERPALNQQELPYLESKIEQEATKQQTKQRAAKFLNNRRQKLSVKQNELEGMTAKREAVIAAEEERLQAIADQEEKLRAEEEALQRQLLAEKNEAARLQREAEEAEAARVKTAEEARLNQEAEEAEAARVKAVEEARIKKEAEEAEAARVKAAEEERLRVEAEQAQEAERLRVLEEEAAKEQARQEAIAREERALEILRQQEEELAIQQQRSTASTATAAGASILSDYASRFNSEFYANGFSSAVDTEKLRLLLSQLGISPGIVGGAAAVLVLGSAATAIKNLVDEAEENIGATSSRDTKPINEQEDDLSSQVAKLLEKKREEKASTVRKTLKISSQGEEDVNPAQTTRVSTPKSVPTSSAQAPPSINFGESTTQPKATPPSAKSAGSASQAPLTSSLGSPKFGTQAGAKNNGFPSSKTSPFENKMPSSSSSTTNFGATPPTKKNFSVSSPKQSSVPSSTDRPGFGSLPSKNSSPPKFGAPAKAFGSPPKKTGGLPGKQGASPFAKSSNVSSPGKQSASPFGTAVPKEKSPSSFGSPPPKFSDKAVSSPFGTAPSNKKTPFGASTPNSVGPPGKKSIAPFNPSAKQAPFSGPTSSSFGVNSSKSRPPSAFGSSTPKAADFGKKAAESSFKQPASPFDTGLRKTPPVQSTPSFGVSSPKASPGTFGSAPPKSKVGEPTFKQANSPFGTAPKKFSSPKEPVSPFGTPNSSTVSTSPFASPVPKNENQPAKKAASPFGNISKAPPSRFSPNEANLNDDQKKPFSPFSQRNASQNKPKPSFSSSGPVYMPPTPKANNAASLKNVYSSLDGNQKKNGLDGNQTKRIREFNDNSIGTPGPKKSFSPFGGSKGVSKSSSTQGMPMNFNDPNASLQPSPFAEQGSKKSFSPYESKPSVSAQETQPNSSSFAGPSTSAATATPKNGVKKSFSPYGRKPKGRDENLPKVDPSSFSFGAPPKSSPSQDPNNSARNGSFSPGLNDASPKPFAATGFPPTGEDFENARSRAIRDDQPRE